MWKLFTAKCEFSILRCKTEANWISSSQQPASYMFRECVWIFFGKLNITFLSLTNEWHAHKIKSFVVCSSQPMNMEFWMCWWIINKQNKKKVSQTTAPTKMVQHTKNIIASGACINYATFVFIPLSLKRPPCDITNIGSHYEMKCVDRPNNNKKKTPNGKIVYSWLCKFILPIFSCLRFLLTSNIFFIFLLLLFNNRSRFVHLIFSGPLPCVCLSMRKCMYTFCGWVSLFAPLLSWIVVSRDSIR